jgi:hypothetical protein
MHPAQLSMICVEEMFAARCEKQAAMAALPMTPPASSAANAFPFTDLTWFAASKSMMHGFFTCLHRILVLGIFGRGTPIYQLPIGMFTVQHALRLLWTMATRHSKPLDRDERLPVYQAACLSIALKIDADQLPPEKMMHTMLAFAFNIPDREAVSDGEVEVLTKLNFNVQMLSSGTLDLLGMLQYHSSVASVFATSRFGTSTYMCAYWLLTASTCSLDAMKMPPSNLVRNALIMAVQCCVANVDEVATMCADLSAVMPPVSPTGTDDTARCIIADIAMRTLADAAHPLHVTWSPSEPRQWLTAGGFLAAAHSPSDLRAVHRATLKRKRSSSDLSQVF